MVLRWLTVPVDAASYKTPFGRPLLLNFLKRKKRSRSTRGTNIANTMISVMSCCIAFSRAGNYFKIQRFTH